MTTVPRNVGRVSDERQEQEIKSHRKGTKKREGTAHFSTSMDLCHLKNSELEQHSPNNKGRVVLQVFLHWKTILVVMW